MGREFPISQSAALGLASVTAPQDQIELALDCAGVGLWDWDLVSGKSSHSRTNKRMLGFDDTDELGESFEELTAKIHPDDAREMRNTVDRHLRNETPGYRAEFRVLRKDGTFTWFESRGLVVERGPHGEPLRMVGIHVDISERKANEQLRRNLDAALRRNHDELEALVRLQTQKLIDAADAAEQGNRAKNILLARVGDELRRPLNPALESCAQLLDDAARDLPPGVREKLKNIRQSIQQLSASVDRLLDVSSIEANTLEICATPVNLRHVLDEQCESMQLRAQERGIDLRTVSCDEDLVVFADRARLAQVVRELLTNAIRCTTRGYVQVRAKVLDGQVFIEVQDTGRGIPRERQATLFHAFQPAGDQRRLLSRGMGLGLSISRAVIEAMFGDIGVTSKAGRGSRFWFTLPLAASAQKVSYTRH